MKELKVLVFDIETAPMMAYVWERYDQNIATNMIKADWYVLAWAAKWLGDPVSKVMYADQRNSPDIENDKALLIPLWRLLDEADVVITQNGQSFDSPKLNARFIQHGMTPPSPYRHLDTLRIVKSVAKFTSNSLDYLTEKLCVKYKKLAHKKFPGFSLWKECLKGNKAAWDEMKRYNIHDVLSTEELYFKLRPWAPKSMPTPFITQAAGFECAGCGKDDHMQSRGYATNKQGRYPRYQCTACGTWAQGKKVKEAA